MRKLTEFVLGGILSASLVLVWQYNNLQVKDDGPVSIIVEDEPIIITAD